MLPSQAEIDGVYAVKLFLDHCPNRQLSTEDLAQHAGLTTTQLQFTFLHVFHISLQSYRVKASQALSLSFP